MEKVSLKKVFKNDGITIQLLIATVIMIVVSIVLAFTSETDIFNDLGFLVVFTIWIGAGIGLIVRLIWFKKFMPMDKPITAKIIHVLYYRGNKRVRFEYTYNNHTYKKLNTVFNNKQAKSLYKGNEVVVLLNAKNPRFALMRDFYFEDIAK